MLERSDKAAKQALEEVGERRGRSTLGGLPAASGGAAVNGSLSRKLMTELVHTMIHSTIHTKMIHTMILLPGPISIECGARGTSGRSGPCRCGFL